MNFFASDTGLILFAALVCVAGFGDHYTSARGPYYGTSEANKIVSDSGGSYSAIKHNGGIAIALAVGAILHFTAGPGAYSVIYIPLVIGFAIVTYANYKLQTKNRTRQIKFLQDLHDLDSVDHTDSEIEAQFNGLPLKQNKKTKRWRYELFGWLQSSSDDYDTARPDLQRQVLLTSRMDEGRWFNGR